MIDIDTLTEPELRDLNRRIVERLRFLNQMRAHATMLKFSIGERVCFQPDGRPTIFGIITRYHKKTVRVVTEAGGEWNVPPSALRKVSPPASTGESDHVIAPNVIELHQS